MFDKIEDILKGKNALQPNPTEVKVFLAKAR